MTDIINIILNSNNKPAGMPADAFFTDANPHGYMSASEFNKMLTGIGKREVIDFEATLEHIKCAVPFDNVPTIDVDHKDNVCIWVRARLARSNQTLKLPGEKGLVSFLKDYQYGKITPIFTLTELYNAANALKAPDVAPDSKVESEE